MKPTQEQVIAWALKCGARVKSDCQGSGAYGDGVDLNALAALAYEAGYEAGRKYENEACVEEAAYYAAHSLTAKNILDAIRARRKQ